MTRVARVGDAIAWLLLSGTVVLIVVVDALYGLVRPRASR